jgi:5-methylcytosine-specific restriction endonuclease McrA
MSLNKAQREEMRMMFGGRCAYCGCELNGKWHVDHVKPINRDWYGAYKRKRWIEDGRAGEAPVIREPFSKENDCADNLFPSCAPCNIDKGSNTLEGWRAYLHHRIVDRLRYNSSTFRHAERFGVVAINPAPLVFWFEQYATSASSAAKGAPRE